MSVVDLKSISGITSITTPASDNQLTLHTNNTTERLRIASNGRVGIGTVTPNALLDVYSSTAATDKDLLMVRSTTGAFAVQCSSIAASNPTWALRTYSNEDIIFSPGNVEKLRIESGGNIGIGTDISGGGGAYGRLSVVIPSQSGGSALQVMNSAAGSSDGDLTNIVLRSVNNSGTQWAGAEFRAYDYSFKNQGTAALSITSSGDVSISSNGNVHGISKLTILPAGRTTAFSASDGDTWHDVVLKQTGSATNNAVGIAFETSTSGYHKNAGTGIAAVKNGTNSDYGSDLVFITRPQSAVAEERLRITSAGKVLIGDGTTYNPQGLLHIVGDDNSNGPELYLQVNNNNTTDNIGALWFGNNVDKSLVKLAGHTHSANNTADFTVSTSNGGTLGERLRITSDGKVGINKTDPTSQLWVQATTDDNPGVTLYRQSTGGDIASIIWQTGSGTQAKINYRGAAGASEGLQFYTAGGSSSQLRMIIDHSGRMGLGTNDPDEHLEVFQASGTNIVKVSTQANSTIGIELEKTGSTTQSWRIADGQTVNGTLEFYDKTEGETRLAIDGSSRVIIGQASHNGGGALVVCGNSNTPNSYAAASFCRIQANPTSGTTLTNLRFSAGSGGTNRAAEINVKADSNWNDGTSQESKMEFTVASSGGGNTAGNPLMTLKGNGNVEINRGNLVISNDNGISFIEADDTATGETVSSSVLDDYEEGSWTTQLMDGNSSNVTYSNSTARYVKVGRMVYCYFNVTRAETGSKTGTMKFYNLPYLSTNSTLQVTGTWWLDEGSPSQNDAVGGSIYVQQNSRVALFVYPTSEWQQAGNRYLEFSQWQNGRPMYGSFTYEAAA